MKKKLTNIQNVINKSYIILEILNMKNIINYTP